MITKIWLESSADDGRTPGTQLREGHWDKGRHADPKGHRGLWGRTLGLVGFGMIAREVSRVGEAMGMKIVVWRRGGAQGAAQKVPGVEEVATLQELAEKSDVVSVHLTGTRFELGNRVYTAPPTSPGFLCATWEGRC